MPPLDHQSSNSYFPPRKAVTTPYSWKVYSPKAHQVYSRDHQQANDLIADLIDESCPDNQAFGFDIEWRPTFVKGGGENPVALIQISNDDYVLLLQVCQL